MGKDGNKRILLFFFYRVFIFVFFPISSYSSARFSFFFFAIFLRISSPLLSTFHANQSAVTLST